MNQEKCAMRGAVSPESRTTCFRSPMEVLLHFGQPADTCSLRKSAKKFSIAHNADHDDDLFLAEMKRWEMPVFPIDIRFVCTYRGLFKTIVPHYSALRSNQQSQDAWIAYFELLKRSRVLLTARTLTQ